MICPVVHDASGGIEYNPRVCTLAAALTYKHHFNAILETYVNKILHYLNIYILASCCYKVVCAARLIVISSIVTIYIALLDTAL